MEKRFTYKCLHIPTGKVIDRTSESTYWNMQAFLLELNRWNRSGSDWKYWTEEA